MIDFLTALLTSNTAILICLVVMCSVAFKQVLPFSVLAMCFLTVSLYVVAEEHVTQDRFSYYLWYLRSQNSELGWLLDPGFTLILQIFPSRLSYELFSVLLMSGVLILLIFVVLLLRGFTYSSLMILIILLSNRLFLDFLLNTTRSAIGIFLVLLVFSKLRVLKLLSLASLSVHLPMFAVFWTTRIGSYIRLIKIEHIFLALIPIFVLKFLFGLQFLKLDHSIFGSIDRINRLSEQEEFTLSASLFIQVVLFAIVPAILVTFKQAGSDTRSTYLPMILVSMCLFLLFFPEFSLALRVLLVSIPLTTLALGRRNLQIVVLLNLATYLVFLRANIDL